MTNIKTESDLSSAFTKAASEVSDAAALVGAGCGIEEAIQVKVKDGPVDCIYEYESINYEFHRARSLNLPSKARELLIAKPREHLAFISGSKIIMPEPFDQITARKNDDIRTSADFELDGNYKRRKELGKTVKDVLSMGKKYDDFIDMGKEVFSSTSLPPEYLPPIQSGIKSSHNFSFGSAVAVMAIIAFNRAKTSKKRR